MQLYDNLEDTPARFVRQIDLRPYPPPPPPHITVVATKTLY